MAIAKRIFLFAIVNIAIIATISIVLRVTGLDQYLNYYSNGGLNYESLLLFCFVWGMGGSFISLLLSKTMAKWMMGVKIVDANNPQFAGLVQRVHQLAQGAGLNKMPEVGIYNSPEVNAFATGPTKNSALVAVSTGLLQRMRSEEVDGVLGHEVAHIANGDMVTMTLVQGVVNAFVMFFARVLAFAVSNFLRSSDDDGPNHFVEFALIIVFQMVFGLLGMIVVGFFSRWREFRADAGGARLAGRTKMIQALEALRGTTELIASDDQAVASLKISGRSGLMALLSTHPPLEERIARLKAAG